MAATSPPKPGQSAGAPESISTDDWGADWESAFESEGDTFLAEDESETLFLDEEGPAVSPVAARAQTGTATPDLHTSLEESLDQIPDRSVGLSLSFLSVCGPLAPALRQAASSIQVRFLGLPIFIRLPLVLLPLVPLAFFFFSASPKKPATSPSSPPAAIAPLTPAPIPVGQGQPSGLGSTVPIALPGPSEKIRTKWQFPAFLIPIATDNQDQAVAFLQVDITLVAALAPGLELDETKRLFVREAIYQFYRNRPIEDLRRFSLARGEMNAQLLAWLQKQWPDGPIEAIFFDQYRIS